MFYFLVTRQAFLSYFLSSAAVYLGAGHPSNGALEENLFSRRFFSKTHRETGVSRHNEGPIQGPLQPLDTIVL